MVIGQVVDRTALLLRILERIWYWYQQIDSEGLNTAWKGRCISLGQHLQVQYPGGEFEGYGRDIDRQGALILEDHTGQQRRIVFGEATVRQNSQ
jgi:biotin-(acetyl-CoA carboxylase) ligase